MRLYTKNSTFPIGGSDVSMLFLLLLLIFLLLMRCKTYLFSVFISVNAILEHRSSLPRIVKAYDLFVKLFLVSHIFVCLWILMKSGVF